MIRTSDGTAAEPPFSAIDSASACNLLSSSTSSETLSVIRTSSASRSSWLRRPSAISRFNAILILTSLSEQSTPARSEEHTSELQSLMRISYAVFCLKKQTNTIKKTHIYNQHTI